MLRFNKAALRGLFNADAPVNRPGIKVGNDKITEGLPECKDESTRANFSAIKMLRHKKVKSHHVAPQDDLLWEGVMLNQRRNGNIPALNEPELTLGQPPLQNNGFSKQQPRRKSSFLSRNSTSSASEPKRVSFTSHCTVTVYEDIYASQRKWYTLEDQMLFDAEAVLEAQRVRDVIAKYSLEPSYPISRLLKHGVVSSEDLLGIEHKVCGMKRKNVRRRHTDYVLDRQDELKGAKDGLFNVESLATVTINSSSRSVVLARRRAALAA